MRLLPLGLARLDRRQRGLTLIELLVALAIGLLVTIAAASLFIVAQQGFRINDDRTRILENGRLAMDLLSRNNRMAGAINLQPYPPVPIGTVATRSLIPAFTGFSAGAGLLGVEGGTAPDTLSIAYESIDLWDAARLTGADCLAQRVGVNGLGQVTNTFAVNTVNEQLTCAGSGAPGNTQPIVGSVIDLQFQYSLVAGWPRRDGAQDNPNPIVSVVDANLVTNWDQVRAVHVCIEVVSGEPNSLNPGSTVGQMPGLNCRGQPFAADNRVHRLFRSVVNVRNASPGNIFAIGLP